MATLEQIEALDVIRQKRANAKDKHISIAKYLSAGHKKYQTAINTMISVGALSIVSAFLCFCSTTYNLAVLLYLGQPTDILTWVLIAAQYAIFIVTAILGTKLYRLDATPTFALASLIILLLINTAIVIGILPGLTVIFSIIGLICWNTYRNWFDTIANSIAKKQKKDNKTKLKAKASSVEEYFSNENEEEIEIDHHTKNNIAWIITTIVLSILIIGSGAGFYFLGRSHGYDDGKWKGYDAGYSDGTADGYRNGFSGGEAAGYSNGYNVGYNKGYNDMWNKANCIISGGGAYCI